MALYTGKGDDGTTYVFDTPKGERVAKTSPLIEALGTLDELNSFLGICKVYADEKTFVLTQSKTSVSSLVHELQENLFIVQAECAGAEKTISEDKVQKAEEIIAEIENLLPPITTFFISGGTREAAHFDVARTLARRAERHINHVRENNIRTLGEHTIAYMNRLSSVLYALARYANHVQDKDENAPTYQ